MLFSWKSFASDCKGDCTGTMGDKKGGRVLGGGTENGMCFCRNYPVPPRRNGLSPVTLYTMKSRCPASRVSVLSSCCIKTRLSSVSKSGFFISYRRKHFFSTVYSPSTSSVRLLSSTVSGEIFTSVLSFLFTPRMLTPYFRRMSSSPML